MFTNIQGNITRGSSKHHGLNSHNELVLELSSQGLVSGHLCFGFKVAEVTFLCSDGNHK